MRVVLDECVDRRLAGAIVSAWGGPDPAAVADLDVRTVPQMGWAGVRNGQLLGLVSDHAEVLITTDRSLRFQHPIERFDFALVVLRARSNRLADLLPLVPDVVRVLPRCVPGAVFLLPLEGSG